MIRKILKRFFGGLVIDLGAVEGDFRFATLKDDIAQSLINITVINISVLAMLRVDAILYEDHPELFRTMLLYRLVYVLVSLVFGVFLYRIIKVRIFDRLLFGWMLFTVIFLVLFNFTRPSDYLTTSFDVIVPFAVYVLSPLRIPYTLVLAFGYSAGTLYVDHFFKFGVDPIVLSVATSAQFIVHVLGLAASLQLSTYRRKSYQALLYEKDAKEMSAYLANIDPLTQSLTRRQFIIMAETEFRRFARYKRPLSLLIIDADHFKEINDTYGHYAGDLTLRSLSVVALEQKRGQDVWGRLGGEEFGLLMPETTKDQALVLAERIRSVWKDSPVHLDGQLIHSTMSIGVAEAGENDESLEDLLRRADRMLYKAKRAGRDRVFAD